MDFIYRSPLGEFFGAVVQAGLASSDGGRRLRPLTSLPPSIAAGQIAGIVACIHLNDPPDLCNQYDSPSLQIRVLSSGKYQARLLRCPPRSFIDLRRGSHQPNKCSQIFDQPNVHSPFDPWAPASGCVPLPNPSFLPRLNRMTNPSNPRPAAPCRPDRRRPRTGPWSMSPLLWRTVSGAPMLRSPGAMSAEQPAAATE